MVDLQIYTNLKFCDQYCGNGRGWYLFPHFHHKISPIYACHGNFISLILGELAVLVRGVVDLHTHTKYVINIVEMGKGCVKGRGKGIGF